MTKHTPGPWTACLARFSADSFSDAFQGDCCAFHITASPHGSVHPLAECSPLNRAIPANELEANADLIAAAPDLLEALKFVLDHIADPERGVRDLYPAFGLNASRAVEMVRAAIGKAEGK